jgi:hypothetical protein
MDHQFLHLIMAPLVEQPKCELTLDCIFDSYVRFASFGSLIRSSGFQRLKISVLKVRARYER